VRSWSAQSASQCDDSVCDSVCVKKNEECVEWERQRTPTPYGHAVGMSTILLLQDMRGAFRPVFVLVPT
jgi:hypothetical protein